MGASGEAGLAAIFLDAGGTQAGQAVLVDGPLPAQELIDGEGVALAGSPPNRGSRKWRSSRQNIGATLAPCKPKSVRGQALSDLC